MSDERAIEKLAGKELHVRLVSNDLLVAGKTSLTAVGSLNADASDLVAPRFLSKRYPEYNPKSIVGALCDHALGRGPATSVDPKTVVLVEERNGNISADDARYIEWLGLQKGERPLVVMVPSLDAAQPAAPAATGRAHDAAPTLAETFWARQWRRMKALPAPVTKDAALAAIPRTSIPVGFSAVLAYLHSGDVPLERALMYIGLAFGFAIGFALLNQTVLNWFTFWSEFTRDAAEEPIKSLRRTLGEEAASKGAAGWIVAALSFVSARGDVLIAAPLLGIGCSYLARLVLGPVGETVSVLTVTGFLMVLSNVVIGSIAGGPYPQVIAHLRAVGKISERASIYLGILDTIKMELGRIADFGMQTAYNAIQVVLATVFWAMLLVVDRCYPKADIKRLTSQRDVAAARELLKSLRSRGVKEPAALA
jgi:hypothetical protein